MSGIDPRINQPLDSATINGRMTDRAIELIGMLNKVIGAEGLGTNTFTLTSDLGEFEQTLSTHIIQANVNDPKWVEDQKIYFGTSHDRLDLIQQKLTENLDNIKTDIADNVRGLFDILNDKEGIFDDFERAVQDATTEAEIKKAEEDLQKEIERVLTSEDTLNEMINAFFENIQLTIQRMDEEIFDLLNDYDGNFSNGSTDKTARKFLVTLPNRAGITGIRPSQIIDSAEEVLRIVLQENKEKYEEKNGVGSYGPEEENEFLNNQVIGSFRTGKLKLSEEMINAIINDQGLSDDELDSIDSMSDFLKMVSEEKLLELATNIYSTNSEEDTLKALFQDHLEITTPKYYEDQRTLWDILSGKSSADDINNENTIFNSVGDQIKRVSNAAIDLFGYGYEKVTSTNLHETIRRNPLSAIEFLEAKKTGLSGGELDNVQNLIDSFIDKQAQAIEFMIEQEEKKGKHEHNKDLVKDLKKILKKLDKYNGDLSKITEEIAKAGPEVQELFGDMTPIDPSLELGTFTGILNEVVRLPNIHQALYVNELREASKINSQFDNRKLPSFKPDGSPPEDNAIAPPNIGPSPLAGVLAGIGDILMQKAHNLDKESNVPTKEWMDENVEMLKTINNQLPGLGMSSAGEAFIDSLRENFKNLIKDFFNGSIAKKNSKDQAKSVYSDANEKTSDLAYLVNNSVIDNGTKISDLRELVDRLDDINFEQEINTRTSQISILTTQITDLRAALLNPDLTQEEIDAINAQIASLESQISTLGAEIISLNQDSETLEASQEVLGVLAIGDADDNKKVVKEFEKVIKDLKKDYQDKIIDYSNSMTNFEADSDGDGTSDIIERFKDSLDEANLDLDGNGQNDFVDIAGIADKIGGLSDNIRNIYGGNEAVKGGIEDQSIRRLILLMFVFSMLEAGEWDARRYEADTTRYQTF